MESLKNIGSDKDTSDMIHPAEMDFNVSYINVMRNNGALRCASLMQIACRIDLWGEQ